MNIMEGDRYSIAVRSVHKKYFGNSEQSLSGITMKIPTGSTYGLLGPSGCGKTTLLKCIMGLLEIDRGDIKLSINQLKQIGYMPQAVSLHDGLNIEELFVFFGFIFGIQNNELNSRVKELSDLLELPPLHRQVGECSGGEQQRLSLGVTLLHDPEILLLDEPTVGLDALLAHKITCYLKDLSNKQKKTILITTHYMEEARSLHIVGFMRKGILLAEDSPESLINQYNCSSLDDVFVKLIKSHQIEDVKKIDDNSSKRPRSPRLQKDSTFKWSHFNAQVYKNYKWTIKNMKVTLFLIAIPFSTILLFNTLFSKLILKIGYYNEELVNSGGTCLNTSAILAPRCPLSPYYSCRYLNQLNESLIAFNSIEDGLNAIKSGETYAFLYFPANFSSSISNRLSFRVNEIENAFEEQQLQVWLDNTLFIMSVITRMEIYNSLIILLERICQECNINTRLAQTTLNIKLERPVYGENYRYETKSYPLLNALNTFCMSFMFIAAAMSEEKSSGVLERIKASGMTNVELISGTYVAQTAVLILQTLALLIVNHAVLNEPFLGSYFIVFTILILMGTLGSLIGLLVTTFTSSLYPIAFMGCGIMMSNLLSNGIMWPLEGIHWLIKPFSNWNPVVIGGLSYSHVMLHGFPVTHPLVYQGTLYLLLCNVLVIVLIHCKIKLSHNQL